MPSLENNFWNSAESIKRYSDMEYKLYDVEAFLLHEAVFHLEKDPRDIKILDLGCGGGRTTVVLHNLGFDITGLDIAENLIERLHSSYPDIKAVVGDAAQLPFDNSTFDIVLFSHNSLDCLYPKSQRAKALEEISRVLKPQGFFIFSSHVFNLIAYNPLLLAQVFRNVTKVITILFGSGTYYVEKMQNGSKVFLYSSNYKAIVAELSRHKLNLLRSSRIINYEKNLVYTLLKSLTNWERYYLAQKIS